MGTTGLHRCIVGATTKEETRGRRVRRAPVRRRTTWRCSTSTAWSTSAADAVARRRRALADVRGRPACAIAFITNNAARTPEQVAEHLRELGVERRREDVVDLGPGGGPAAGRARTAPVRRSPCWVRDGLREALREPGSSRSASATEAVAIVSGLRARGAVADDHAGGGADPRRAALGGQQHRPDASRPPTGSRPGHGALVEMIARVRRRRPGGGRQAAAAAVRRDRCAGSGASAADGRRPPGHRHRGRRTTPGPTRCW